MTCTDVRHTYGLIRRDVVGRFPCDCGMTELVLWRPGSTVDLPTTAAYTGMMLRIVAQTASTPGAALLVT